MARAIWSGSISFGLVNVPVKLHAAVRRKDVHFHQLDEKSGARIRNRRVSETSGREVPNERIVKGYEFEKGAYVPVTDEELEAVEPERTHTIDVEDFVSLHDVDPLQYVNTYWVAPDGAKGAPKAYALLRDAMDRTDRVAIARFVLRTKEHLVMLRPVDNALALHTMLYPDEIVASSDVDGLPVRVKADARELKMASQLVESLTVEWDPKRYKDTYRERLLDVIKRKAKGEEIVTEPQHEKSADVVDLMAALEASIEASKQRGGRSKTKSRSRARKSA
ncbi:MAG TPA: Ku protein [Acidimicrobiales bacterium]|jgi:DNA end-binding protein Ku|nr:Ku protein [Acidimicrobiales bacterium]